MPRPTNPPRGERLLRLPQVGTDNSELAQQTVPHWLEPKGIDRFHESSRVGTSHATKIRNLMFEDAELVSRRGTDLMGGEAASVVMQVIDLVRQGQKKVTVRFCLRHIEVFEYGSGTWRSFPVPLTGAERDYFAYTGWADKLLFSNGVDGLWEFDFKTYTAKIVPGAPGAKHLTTFGNRVVASAVIDKGNFLPLRVQWSAKNKFDDWTGIGSGFEDLYGSPGGVTDEAMGVFPTDDTRAWLVRSRSVYQMSLSGNASAPFRFDRILSGIGSPFRNSIASVPSGIIFVSYNNVHLIDASGHQLLGNNVIDEIQEEVETLRFAFGTFDVGRLEYRLACDRLVWRYRLFEQGWTLDEYPWEIRSLGRQIEGKVGIPIDLLPGTIDELSVNFPPGSIDDLVYWRESDDSMMFVPESTRLTVRENDSTDDTLLSGDQIPAEILIDTGVVNSDLLSAVELHEMHLEYISEMEQELIFEATFNDGETFQPLSGPKAIEETLGSEILFCKVERVSRKLQIRLRSLTLGKLRILGFAPTIVKVNRPMASKKPRIASITVLPSPLSMLVGGTQQLSITLRSASGSIITGRQPTIVSTNSAVASVSLTGVVRAIAPGNFAIVVSLNNVQTVVNGSVTAVTPVAVSSVTITPSVSQGASGSQQQFTATVRDAGGNILVGRTITWASADGTIATVNGSGLVTLVSPGATTITAICEGVTGAATLTVTASAAVVVLVQVTPGSFSGDVGDTIQLVALPKDSLGNVLSGKTISWTSSHTAVATVNSAGLVTLVGAGSVVISATCETIIGTATGTAVAPPVAVASVLLSPTSFSRPPGSTQQLTATVKDSSGNVLTGRVISWSSSNTSIATVDSTGLVSALAQGSVLITANCEGILGTSFGTISATPVASVVVSPATFSVAAGGVQQLSATPKDAAGNPLSGRVVTWGSSDPTKATVSNTGLVTGVSAGACTITAVCETIPGTAAATVTTPAVSVATVTVAPSTFTKDVGVVQQLVATAKDASNNVLTGRTFTWSSSDPTRATVSSSGLVTPLLAGTVTITATCEGVNGTSVGTINAAAPPGVISVTGNIHRLLTGSGTLRGIFAVPLLQGELSTSTLNKFKFLIGGVEKAISIVPLEGRWPDGTLRSVRVQCDHNLTAGSPLAAEVRIGETRTTVDIAPVGVNTQTSLPATHPSFGIGADGTTTGGFQAGTHQFELYGFPDAMFVPSGARLRATGILLPMLDRDTEHALGGEYARRIDDFETGASLRWSSKWNAATWPGVFANDIANVAYDEHYYDRANGYFAHFFATGNVEYFRQGCSYYFAWRELYAHPNNYRYDPYHSFVEGSGVHYWLTGDDESRRCVIETGRYMVGATHWDPLMGSRHSIYQDPRNMAYTLKAWMEMYRLGFLSGTSSLTGESFVTLDKITTALNRVLGVGTFNNTGQYPSDPLGEGPMYQTSGAQDGMWAQGYQATCPNTLTMFMEGGLVPDVLIKYYTWITPDSRILTAVKKAIDWSWANHWRPNLGLPTEKSFDYLTDNACPSEGGQTASPILNHLYTNNFAWVGRQLGDSSYFTKALSIMEGADSTNAATDLVSSGKLFNQQQVLSYPAAKNIQG